MKPRSLDLKEGMTGEILQFRAQVRRTLAQSSHGSKGRVPTSEVNETLRPALECCNRTVKAHNDDALLAGMMVTHGSAWPLLPQKQLVLATELANTRDMVSPGEEKGK